MLTTYRQACKTLVFAKNTPHEGIPVGKFLDVIINPDKGHFEAFWVQSLQGLKCLMPQDVLSWNAEEIWIQEETVLNKIENLPRVSKIVETEIPILKAFVWIDKNTKPLGRVHDFSFDSISPRILSLHVATSWFGGYGPKVIIPAQRILKIDTKGIHITNSLMPLKAKEKIVKSKIEELEKKVPEMDVREKN